mmetsp:Transcript_100955/g.268374  ORF Transcript_100955/g.268374 Transcript_100955/m.268374 type:complete len:447 (-) Transcript_100955:34-1374(-)
MLPMAWVLEDEHLNLGELLLHQVLPWPVVQALVSSAVEHEQARPCCGAVHVAPVPVGVHQLPQDGQSVGNRAPPLAALRMFQLGPLCQLPGHRRPPLLAASGLRVDAAICAVCTRPLPGPCLGQLLGLHRRLLVGFRPRTGFRGLLALRRPGRGLGLGHGLCLGLGVREPGVRGRGLRLKLRAAPRSHSGPGGFLGSPRAGSSGLGRPTGSPRLSSGPHVDRATRSRGRGRLVGARALTLSLCKREALLGRAQPVQLLALRAQPGLHALCLRLGKPRSLVEGLRQQVRLNLGLSEPPCLCCGLQCPPGLLRDAHLSLGQLLLPVGGALLEPRHLIHQRLGLLLHFGGLLPDRLLLQLGGLRVAAFLRDGLGALQLFGRQVEFHLQALVAQLQRVVARLQSLVLAGKVKKSLAEWARFMLRQVTVAPGSSPKPLDIAGGWHGAPATK